MRAINAAARSMMSFSFDIGAIVSKNSPISSKGLPVLLPQATLDVIRHPTRLYE
jgi:hypothetical protein